MFKFVFELGNFIHELCRAHETFEGLQACVCPPVDCQRGAVGETLGTLITGEGRFTGVRV